MQEPPEMSLKRKALFLSLAWAITAAAMTIIWPISWTFFWAFAYYSPVTWLLSFVAERFLSKQSDNFPIVVGWFYYLALTIVALWPKRRLWFYIIYALLLISLALNVEGCREWSHASFS